MGCLGALLDPNIGMRLIPLPKIAETSGLDANSESLPVKIPKNGLGPVKKTSTGPTRPVNIWGTF